MLESWKKKTIRFLLGQTVSLFGSSLVQYAILWYITLETKSGVMMMVSIVCGFLPGFFISPFAGVWADRYNRKLLIVVADAAIAIATLTLAVLFIVGIDALWLLFVMSAIRSLGTGVQIPAVGAFLPQIVPEEKLTRVNALNTTIQSVITLVSPMASGFLLTVASIETIFFIDVATAAIAIFVLMFLLHVPSHQKAQTKQTTGYFTDLKLGLLYIRKHEFILRFMIFSALFFILVAPAAFLTPLQVARSFGGEVWRLSAIEVAFSAGMILGGVLMASWGGFKNRIHTMAFAGFLLGACTFLLGVVPVFWIYLFIMAFTGVAVPVFNTPSTVLLQEKIEEDYMGRVFGIFGMIVNAVMPLAMLLFGPLAEAVAIEWLLIITGVLMSISCIAMLYSKVLIEAGRPKAIKEQV